MNREGGLFFGGQTSVLSGDRLPILGTAFRVSGMSAGDKKSAPNSERFINQFILGCYFLRRAKLISEPRASSRSPIPVTPIVGIGGGSPI